MNGSHISRRQVLRFGGFTTLSLATGGLTVACGGEGSGSAGVDALGAIRKRGFALFGFDGEKPFNYLDPGGDLVGSEIDIARTALKRWGFLLWRGSQ